MVRPPWISFIGRRAGLSPTPPQGPSPAPPSMEPGSQRLANNSVDLDSPRVVVEDRIVTGPMVNTQPSSRRT